MSACFSPREPKMVLRIWPERNVPYSTLSLKFPSCPVPRSVCCGGTIAILSANRHFYLTLGQHTSLLTGIQKPSESSLREFLTG